MSSRLSIFLLLLFAFPAWNCKKENACDCFKRTGDVVTEERQPGDFHNVYVEDNVNLIFVEDTTSLLRVEAGKNLVKLIKTESDGSWLRIRNDNKCNFTRRYDVPVNVYIHYRRNQVFHIKSKATGEITNANPSTSDSLDLDIESSGDINFSVARGIIYTHQHGAGDVTVTGNADQVIIYSTGTGFTISDGCTSFYTWVYTNTTGKITVNPTTYLTTKIEGSGNVYYKSNPPYVTNIETSTGRLLPLP